jgi:hypothetical protein
MTDTSVPTSFAPSDFRVGGVLSRTASVLSRHFLVFIVVTIVANLPLVLLLQGVASMAAGGEAPGQTAIILFVLGIVLFFVLSILSQAVIVHAAFQAMRARPISLGESVGVGLARFLPIIGLAFISGLLIGLGIIALIVPGLILVTMWFVGTPACVVERLGPWTGLKRSAQLTKGHRWKVFGLLALLFIISAVVSNVIELALAPLGNIIISMLGTLIWSALWGAFYAIAVVVAYHDLRVAKEGIDIEQITAVFD